MGPINTGRFETAPSISDLNGLKPPFSGGEDCQPSGEYGYDGGAIAVVEKGRLARVLLPQRPGFHPVGRSGLEEFWTEKTGRSVSRNAAVTGGRDRVP